MPAKPYKPEPYEHLLRAAHAHGQEHPEGCEDRQAGLRKGIVGCEDCQLADAMRQIGWVPRAR